MGRLIDSDEFLKRVKKDREHEIYLHCWTADDVLERLDSYYAPTIEVISKDQYENRLKADMVAMLTEIQLEIEELKDDPTFCHHYKRGVNRSSDIIQQKIDALKTKNED